MDLHCAHKLSCGSPRIAASCCRTIVVCDEWTVKLRGQIFEPEHLWFVHEREFSTVSGEKTRYCLP